MLRYSWPMVPNSMSAWIMRMSDRLVVIAVMGISANAVYSVANKLPSLLNLAQNTFTLAWQENAAVVSKDKDVSEYYSHMFSFLVDFLTGFFCILVAATPILFRLLIRGNYAEAYNQIPILFVAMYFLGLSTYLGGIFIAYKRSRSIGMTTVAAAAINLIVDIGTIKYIGLYAASGSTLVSYLFLFIFRLITVQKIITVKYDIKHMLLMFSLIIISSILCFMQKLALDIVNMVFGIVIFTILNKSFIKVICRKVNSLIKSRLAKRS